MVGLGGVLSIGGDSRVEDEVGDRLETVALLVERDRECITVASTDNSN